MKLRNIPLSKLDNDKKKSIIDFMFKYGDKRITHKSLRWFKKLSREDQEDHLVSAALDNKKIAGVIVFGTYGLQESFVAVHPDYREQGVGELLLLDSIIRLPKVYTRVACDNIPSLKLCFRCGMIAFKMTKGPTGKPTLWLAAGGWDSQDIL